jgi:uncharacterized protein (DUF2147 family)
MKPYTLCSGFVVVVLSLFFIAGSALADPKGLWLAQDGAHVHVGKCGSQALCATIAEPKAGGPTTDINNPDPAQRGRSLVGVTVLYNMMPDGPGRWSGTLYNTDDGHTYPGHLLDLGPSTIRIEGCAIGICGGRNLSRLQ